MGNKVSGNLRIGLYSPSPQSGKSTTADYLISKYSFDRVVLANTLKKMTGVFLLDLGFTPDIVERMIYGDLKETIIKSIGKSPRDLMVSIGTDWGRAKVKESIWIDIATSSLSNGINYVSDDIRYLNEADTFRQKGFKIVRLYNPRVPTAEGAVSEGNLEGYDFDFQLINSGDFEELYKQVDEMLLYFNEG